MSWQGWATVTVGTYTCYENGSRSALCMGFILYSSDAACFLATVFQSKHEPSFFFYFLKSSNLLVENLRLILWACAGNHQINPICWDGMRHAISNMILVYSFCLHIDGSTNALLSRSQLLVLSHLLSFFLIIGKICSNFVLLIQLLIASWLSCHCHCQCHWL